MFRLQEYSNNYLKAYGSSWQYSEDELQNTLADSESFKFKSKFEML